MFLAEQSFLKRSRFCRCRKLWKSTTLPPVPSPVTSWKSGPVAACPTDAMRITAHDWQIQSKPTCWVWVRPPWTFRLFVPAISTGAAFQSAVSLNVVVIGAAHSDAASGPGAAFQSAVNFLVIVPGLAHSDAASGPGAAFQSAEAFLVVFVGSAHSDAASGPSATFISADNFLTIVQGSSHSDNATATASFQSAAST